MVKANILLHKIVLIASFEHLLCQLIAGTPGLVRKSWRVGLQLVGLVIKQALLHTVLVYKVLYCVLFVGVQTLAAELESACTQL